MGELFHSTPRDGSLDALNTADYAYEAVSSLTLDDVQGVVCGIIKAGLT